MRLRAVAVLTFVLVPALALAAAAKEPAEPRKRDGALHVSGGGVVGYVGGSGGISGNVRGPGGGGGSGSAQPVVDDKPTALEGGVTSDAPIPVTPSAPAATRRAGAWPAVTWALAVLAVGALIWLYRRRPAAS